MISGLRTVNQTAACSAMGTSVSTNFTQAATGPTSARKTPRETSSTRMFAAAFIAHLERDATYLRNLIAEMYWDSDGFTLVGQRALDRLFDPPRGISAQLRLFRWIETLDCFGQSDVSL